MVLVCGGGWVGASAHVVWRFGFVGLGWGGQSGGEEGGRNILLQHTQRYKDPGTGIK